ncbi:hypothetical protein GO755_35095 [Spirosoma sp. HMF4905]|uniref:Uncharacterized protein n=1 Tax=Spirosoma arboris TaxID=2682092 RepID=A0A7K1SNC6_9BACT|nr:hypothetical protein [Spirosoma arboris]MVM35302.1 hypothetical protein [Spirosoma arboris]
MKNSVLSLLLLVAFGITSCKKTAQVNPELDPKDDPKKVYTLDLQQAKLWLPGKWKLVKVYASISNPPVPIVELVINENQISLIQDGIQTDKVDFDIVKTDYGLLIKTNAQPRADNWYVRNPGLYINKNRMFFDLGMAVDGPAYEFTKGL